MAVVSKDTLSEIDAWVNLFMHSTLIIRSGVYTFHISPERTARPQPDTEYTQESNTSRYATCKARKLCESRYRKQGIKPRSKAE